MEKYILDGQYGKYLEMIGVKVGEALKASGVPEDLFSHKKPTLDEADYYRFMDAVGKQIKDPQLPITVATADQIETFSPPIFASYCSKNGMMCCERLARHKRIIAPMRYELTETEDTFKLEIDASKDDLVIPQFLVESEMVFVLHIIRNATKEDIVPIEIRMTDPPKADNFSQYAKCPVVKAEENAIIFHAGDMEKPFISYNEAMWEFFEPELQKRLYEMERDDSFSARVRSALTELLPGGMSTVDDVAEKLGVGKRTLQRKLTEEDTSFQKQLNSTRELLAKNYLRNTDMSSDDIAFLLGYQEINSFLRAFNLWTGMSVSEYRKQQK